MCRLSFVQHTSLYVYVAFLFVYCVSCTYHVSFMYHVPFMCRVAFVYHVSFVNFVSFMPRASIIYLVSFVYCLYMYCSCDRLLTVEQESVRPHNLEAHLRPRKVKTPPWQKQLDVIIRLYSVYLTKFCVAKNVLCKQETFWALVLNQ